eukprot:GDKH01010889.1.p1 GENE.GDKH01010889.1~~GDKH01010889.1.p1  ORF type:complete len:258 (-),score=35.03 GDKH01010889.1:810-1583(-)
MRNDPYFKYVVLLASYLSAQAGFVNSFSTILAIQKVSHVTGTLTDFSRAMAQGDEKDWLLFAHVAAFLFGSFLGGLMMPSAKLSLRMPYGLVMILESVLIAVSVWLFVIDSDIVATLLLATSMGLQNGFGTFYSNAVVRTTHMTGVTTDIGMLMGECARRRTLRHPDAWKLLVWLPIVLGFLGGGVVGTLLSHSPIMLLLPAGLTFSIGCVYLFVSFRYLARDGRTVHWMPTGLTPESSRMNLLVDDDDDDAFKLDT